MSKQKIRKYAEWQQKLDGLKTIKWYRRPWVKLKYWYWKRKNKK